MSKSEEVTKPATKPATKGVGFFPWLFPALKSRRKLKTWIRCCTVLAATMILLVDTKTLQTMGQAAFFASIVAVMLPPSLALSLFVYAAITLIIGMLIGWAWGCAAMAAGLSVRNQSLLARQQQQAQSSLVPGVPVTAQLQLFVFQGMFLDPRVSAVYGAFFFIGTFALGFVRAYVPKLTLLAIFGTIVLDVMCSYGPLFPTAQYTLAKLFLIPTLYYVAISIAALVLIFPESLNHVWLTSLGESFLAPTLGIITIQSKALSSRPSDHESWAALTAQGAGLRQALVGGFRNLLGQIGFIDLELSVGRLGPSDIKRINRELRSLLFRTAGLLAFQTFVNDSNIADEKEEAAIEKQSHNGTSTPTTADRFTTLRRQVREREAKHGHDLDTLIPILSDSSADLRTACEAGIKGITEWFQDCNSGRWTGFFSKRDNAKIERRHKALEDHLAVLENALQQFQKVERVRLIKPFEKFFDPETGVLLESITKHPRNPDMFAVKSLFMCFMFSDTLVAFSERLAKVLAMLIDLDGRRPTPRLWTPSGFGKLGRKLTSKYDVDDTVTPLAAGSSTDPTQFPSDDGSSDNLNTEDDEDDPEEDEEIPHRARNPDALPPTTAFGRMGLKLGSIIAFFRSAEGIFCLRHAVVSIALWIPTVCVTSAWFTYRNRGLWALIMSQTGLAVYAGDQIAGFVVRLGGSLLGLLLGMVIWYIGAGLGHGSPYGIVIATTFFVAPSILGRIAAPPQDVMIWTMTGVTAVLIVGYSWIDTHIPVVSNSGVGVDVGWKRALLIIIGFTAGFIVMMFPRVTSSRTLVRRTLAATTEELGHIFAGEVEAFLAEEARARRGFYEKVEFVGEHVKEGVSPKEKRVRKLAKKVVEVSTRLQGLAPSLKTARLEPQVKGLWPYQQYELLFATQMKIVSSLVLLTGALIRLDTKWCSILVHRTPFLNPNLLADVFSNVAILSHALSGAHHLPASLPNLRDRLVYHGRHVIPNRGRAPPSSSKDQGISDSESESDVEGPFDFGGGKVDGVNIGFEELSLDVLSDDQLPAHSTAVIALSSILSLLDESTNIIRALCGEMSFRGIHAHHQEHLGREERAFSRRFDPSHEKV